MLVDFAPIFLFFIAYKLAGLYVATGVAIFAAALQILYTWSKTKNVEALHLITFFSILLLGGATLFFHNEWFIKWKPTVVNWSFAVVFLVTHYLAKKPLIQTLLGQQITVPDVVWRRLNWIWVGFFIMIGAVNLWVAYHMSTNAWVNFKLFGMLGLTIIFIFIQAIVLSKYMIEPPKSQDD